MATVNYYQVIVIVYSCYQVDIIDFESYYDLLKQAYLTSGAKNLTQTYSLGFIYCFTIFIIITTGVIIIIMAITFYPI